MPKKRKIISISIIVLILVCGVIAYLFTAGDTITRDGKTYKKDSSYNPHGICNAIASECGICVKVGNIAAKTIVENGNCYVPI
jgi:hypothetical protein